MCGAVEFKVAVDGDLCRIDAFLLNEIAPNLDGRRFTLGEALLCSGPHRTFLTS